MCIGVSMEKLMKELIETVNRSNSFSWNEIIGIIALVCSWITIGFLLLERHEKNRPYLQITFELVRSNLACLVLRNVGNVPLSLKELIYDEEFIKQLPEDDYKRLKEQKITDMKIFPGKQWIICLGVIIPEILEKYEKTDIEIKYAYSKLNRNKRYKEETVIDFNQYSKFLVYISEIDELTRVNEKIVKDTNTMKKELKKISANIVSYADLTQRVSSNIVTGYSEDK